jgi:hypothetical protein
MKIAIVAGFAAIWNVEVNQDWFINELTMRTVELPKSKLN